MPWAHRSCWAFPVNGCKNARTQSEVPRRQPQRGPQSSPARDRVRDLAVAMRKRNLSVYDMQREPAAAGHIISINSLTVLLREEGFSRLPRRADDERPVTVKPEIADVADVRRLDLSP